ncbi:MAG: PAS domain-containing protein, partial [Verrucomicrobia bacterium]|nr:PAS domain-containing protein [Verrucomicrobiota bacterium]
MNKSIQPTAFAPAERADQKDLRQAAAELAKVSLLQRLYEALEIIILILNRQRQIVFANKRLLEFLGIDSLAMVIGQRSGEVFDCVHAFEEKGGCGTTEFCSQCGAVKAILKSQADNQKVIQECHILRKNGKPALDVKISASPLPIGNQDYTIVAVEDIGDKKRRRVLERLFFHDIMNSAVGVRALSELLPTVPETEVPEVGRMINTGANSLVLEIDSQKELVAIESNELIPRLVPVNMAKLFQTIDAIYKNHVVAKGKHLIIRPVDPQIYINTDATLLGRVLSNMTKNALEASAMGESITIGYERLNDREARFAVHNPAVMPREVQLQIFQRSFSTKGEGRGLGTYSIKLITERYLNGSAGFTSNKGEGTFFYVSL